MPRFLRRRPPGAVLLVAGAVAALVWANSPWSAGYEHAWSRVVTVGVGDRALRLDVRQWVNDGAMTFFFLGIGAEIKREVLEGHLSTKRAALLPVVAALGGMLLPAAIYLAVAGGTAPRGWAIPVATDIALALGAVSLAGSRVPPSLRAVLLGLAVVDDIGAIVVIAVAYSSGIGWPWLAVAAAVVASVVVASRVGWRSAWVHVPLGLVLWFSLHEAGVHPTIAGVAMGLAAPMPAALEERLAPWTSSLVVPVFALANAGVVVSLASVRDALTSAIFWGVALGLFVGKTVGVVGATELAVRAGLVDRPAQSRRPQLLGLGAAAGVGFTVSLFIADSAFGETVAAADAKLAILTTSVVAAAVSLAWFRLGSRPPGQSRRRSSTTTSSPNMATSSVSSDSTTGRSPE